jgi:hypothetical protein
MSTEYERGTPEQQERIREKVSDWAIDLPDGGWRISDYGLPKIEKYLGEALMAKTAERRLVFMDMALNVIHQQEQPIRVVCRGWG